jgi:hypothetical protein
MKIYVITGLEELQDGNYAYTCDKYATTFDGAKKLLEKYTNELVKEYEEDFGFECEVAKYESITEITIGCDIGFVKLEIYKVESEEN